jgi:hypothetical protein
MGEKKKKKKKTMLWTRLWFVIFRQKKRQHTLIQRKVRHPLADMRQDVPIAFFNDI